MRRVGVGGVACKRRRGPGRGRGRAGGPVGVRRVVRDAEEGGPRRVTPAGPAVVRGALRHFCSRRAMDIEGLGEKQIEYFYESEDLPVKAPADIFTLRQRDARNVKKLKDVEGFGDVSMRNLFDAIDARREVPLERFVNALGVRHVGETTANQLARA